MRISILTVTDQVLQGSNYKSVIFTVTDLSPSEVNK